MAKKKSNPSSEKKVTAGKTGGDDYVVLARKYRPQTFDDLIGQEAMVTTLRNAFATDRIAQGYMLTGVRGVGKTTTARILARALNYSLPKSGRRAAIDHPTIDMPELGEHCAQIIESRHPDVIEMDAASNTGVDNMREIIEGARYKPMVARYKVYIIDEVHMLSTSAFNALLKTLEEPPEHVKFIFATTEVRKVPVTVLSRCQRFDLRRIDVPALTAHFRKIAKIEGARADDDALALIARAAGGSVRDGLSILDQAIAVSLGQGSEGAKTGNTLGVQTVRDMLGLADRSRIFDLMEHVFAGRAGDALEELQALHRDGAEPSQILSDLAEATHITARLKTVGPEHAEMRSDLSAEEIRRVETLARRLSMALLSRSWQTMLTGLDETAKAPDPLAAAEMVLIRLAYLADLPAPEALIRLLKSGDSTTSSTTTTDAPSGSDHAAQPARARSTPTATASAGSARTAEGAKDTNTSRASGDLPPRGSPEEGDDKYTAANPPRTDNKAQDTHAPVSSDLSETPGQALMPRSFSDVIDLARAHRDAKLVFDLEEHVSLVKFEPPTIDLHLLPGAPGNLGNEVREKLNEWTGLNWILALSKEPGQPPLGQLKREQKAARIATVSANQAVRQILDAFPGAEIVDIQAVNKSRKDDSASG